jgi:RimJ/RimL family protein N-acetyltransferase
MFMAQDEAGNRLGQVRFDRAGNAAEIDIAVSPAMRGKGIGTLMLKKGCQSYFERCNVDRLVAEIKSDNEASRRVFEKAGFEVQQKDDDFVRMELCR